MTARNSLAHIVISLVCVVVLATGYGCERRGWEQIPIEDVRRILPDYTLLVVSLDQRSLPDSQRRAAYESFLQEYGYTLSDWDSSMTWYARNELTLLHDIYRTAADSMERAQASLQTRLDEVVNRETYETNRRIGALDSVNLLSIGSRICKGGDKIKVDFDFYPSLAYDSTRRVELSTNLYGMEHLDTLVYPLLELRLYFTDTTTLYASTPLLCAGHHVVSLSIPSGKKARRITGAVRGRMPRRLWWMMQLDSLRLVRYPMIEGAAPLVLNPEESTASETIAVDLEEEFL